MILSAALVLLGARATTGYTVTDLGHFAVYYGQGLSINSHDDVAMMTTVPIYGPNPQDVDMDIDTYVWSNGVTTHVENPASPGDRVCPTFLKDDGSLQGAIMGADGAPTSMFTWSKTDGFAIQPGAGQPAMLARLTDRETYLLEAGVDSTHTQLRVQHDSNVLSQTEVGEFFQPMAINQNGVIVGDDSPDGGDFHAVRIDPGQGAVPLAMPSNPLSRQATSTGYDINDAGYVAGSAWLGSYPSAHIPEIKMGAIWAPDGTLTSVSDPNGLFFFKINNHNQAVGWKGMHRASCAVVYDSVNGLRDLNTLVPAGTPNLISASAINDKGSIVCVSADNDVFLLKPIGD